ncbi:MAG TPA: 1-deoxy-D-xylulose-5-phosphate synthase N-terminal domain-containing protein [Terriglobales bacterium]|nr:1-deoxy-D-xylulose-5-phosphate synthase N-terminal domain-containing protein [Terriglobales bacterium]
MAPTPSRDDLALLESIQRRVLWLAALTVHHANTRPNPDGTKVGGHQASSTSVASLMTALYFGALREGDVVATKAHASPVLYAIEYLRGRLTADDLKSLRVLGGLQAYPSRRKNPSIIDLSTGSMGLGAVTASFAALAGRYVSSRWGRRPPERFIAMVGDAELDEGNVWESLLEEHLAGLGNLLWIVDMNRQSLDRVVPDTRRRQVAGWFEAAGWRVIELRWGRRLQSIFGRTDGARLRSRLESMGNAEYQALLRRPAGAVRKALVTSSDGQVDIALDRFLGDLSDPMLHAAVGDVGGHDIATILEAFEEAGRERSRPCVLLAQTVKGWGLPLAGDPMNHGALLSAAQMEILRETLGVTAGHEWDVFPASSPESRLIAGRPAPFASSPLHGTEPEIPESLDESYPAQASSQEAFGRVLGKLGRLPVGDHIVTLSADVAVTTHLAGWINRKGVWAPSVKPDFFAETPQAMQWKESPAGQHVELGIAEHNLFLALGAFGLSRELSGVPLMPIGTLYDPFITRGLDALYHALYAGGKFIVVATPSGVSLSPEGGAHQSVITPGVGVALPAIAYYEPTFALEVEWILLHALASLLDRDNGESLYLRLSTKPVDQSLAPAPGFGYRESVLRGGYRLIDARSESGWDAEANAVHLFAAGVMLPEAIEAARALRAQNIFASVFAVTSPDKLYRGLRDPRPYLEDLVTAEEEDVPIVSVLDGHSHGLSFLGSALGVPQMALGVDTFGQSGSRRDLYAHYGIDAPAITHAALTLLGRQG